MLGNFLKNRSKCRLLFKTFKICLILMKNETLSNKQVGSQASRRVTRRLAWVQPCLHKHYVGSSTERVDRYKTCEKDILHTIDTQYKARLEHIAWNKRSKSLGETKCQTLFLCLALNQIMKKEKRLTCAKPLHKNMQGSKRKDILEHMHMLHVYTVLKRVYLRNNLRSIMI